MEKISNCEKMIMTVIWNQEADSDLHSVMTGVKERYGKEWKPQTVSTFIARLAKKGYLKVCRKGRASYYIPQISLPEFRAFVLTDLVQTLYSGDSKALVQQIAEIYGR